MKDRELIYPLYIVALVLLVAHVGFARAGNEAVNRASDCSSSYKAGLCYL